MNSRRTVMDVLFAGARHVAAVLAGVLTIPLVGRALGDEAIGAWAILGTSSYLIGVSDLGLTTAVHRAAVQRDDGRAQRTLSLAIQTTCLVAPLLAFISAQFLEELPKGRTAAMLELSPGIAVAMAAGVIAAATGPIRGFAMARGEMASLAQTRAFASFTQIVCTAIGLQLRPSMLAPSAALFLANAIELGLTARVARQSAPKIWLGPTRNVGTWREVRGCFRDGSAALATNVAVLAAVRVDLLILAQSSTLAAVAAYGVASRAVDQSFTLAKQASAALLPRIGNPETRGVAVRLGTGVLGTLVASGMAALVFHGKGLLVAWAGDVANSATAVEATALLALSAMMAAWSEMPNSALTLGGRSAWAGAWPHVMGSFVGVFVAVGFGPAYGVKAVAGGAALGNLVTAAISWAWAKRLMCWNGRAVFRTLAPSFVAGTVATLTGVGLLGIAPQGLTGDLFCCATTIGAGCGTAALFAKRFT